MFSVGGMLNIQILKEYTSWTHIHAERISKLNEKCLMILAIMVISFLSLKIIMVRLRRGITVTLKAHRQVPKKRCFEKYCSCDKACQFWALLGTPWRSYLENQTIGDKFINNQVQLFIPGGPKKKQKKNTYKTETFLLFGKIVKKLIITGITIINSIITKWKTILWWTNSIN